MDWTEQESIKGKGQKNMTQFSYAILMIYIKIRAFDFLLIKEMEKQWP